MIQILFDEKEKEYMNNRPAHELNELEDNKRLIIKNGEIVGYEKLK